MNVQNPEQEDVERITKASSDATELYAPSKPSAAADIQTTAGIDAGGKELHYPAVAPTLEYTRNLLLAAMRKNTSFCLSNPEPKGRNPHQTPHSNRVLPFPHPRDYGTPLTTSSRRVKIL